MSKTPLFFASEDVLKFSFEIEGNQQCLVPSLLSVGEFRRHMELQGVAGRETGAWGGERDWRRGLWAPRPCIPPAGRARL